MNIETIRIDKIYPYPLNNKTHPEHQIAALVSIIREVGFLKPLHLDESNIILTGHGAFAAGKRAGLTEFPVIKHFGLSDDQKKAFRIADNKLADLSFYNYENIAIEVNELLENDFDISLIGFTDLELANMLKDIPNILPKETAPAKVSTVKEHERAVAAPIVVKNGRVLIAGDVMTLGGLEIKVLDQESAADADWIVRRWESKTGESAINAKGITFKELSNARK